MGNHTCSGRRRHYRQCNSSPRIRPRRSDSCSTPGRSCSRAQQRRHGALSHPDSLSLVQVCALCLSRVSEAFSAVCTASAAEQQQSFRLGHENSKCIMIVGFQNTGCFMCCLHSCGSLWLQQNQCYCCLPALHRTQHLCTIQATPPGSDTPPPEHAPRPAPGPALQAKRCELCALVSNMCSCDCLPPAVTAQPWWLPCADLVVVSATSHSTDMALRKLVRPQVAYPGSTSHSAPLYTLRRHGKGCQGSAAGRKGSHCRGAAWHCL